MKIIFDKDGVKREIETPFEMCGSRQDLETLVHRLQDVLEGDRFSYGWVTIYERQMTANATPRKWTA